MNDNRMIRIMVFEPGRAPYTTMLEDSLEHRQELVGGDIECIPLPCETVLCCNASGKLTGLPENRQYGTDTACAECCLVGQQQQRSYRNHSRPQGIHRAIFRYNGCRPDCSVYDQATDGENDRTYPETDAGSCQEAGIYRSCTIQG